MLLLEALKSNKGPFFFLFHLLYLTRRWHLEIMNFNFCHSRGTKKKKGGEKKKLYQRTCFKYFIFQHNFQIIQEELISCYLSEPIFFSLSRHNVPKKNWPRCCLRSSRGWNVSKRHVWQLRNCWKLTGSRRTALISLIHPVTSCPTAAARCGNLSTSSLTQLWQTTTVWPQPQETRGVWTAVFLFSTPVLWRKTGREWTIISCCNWNLGWNKSASDSLRL